MSWVASASTFLDQVDSSAATAKESGELAAFSYVTDKVVTGIAKVLEDTSSEEDERGGSYYRYKDNRYRDIDYDSSQDGSDTEIAKENKE